MAAEPFSLQIKAGPTDIPGPVIIQTEALSARRALIKLRALLGPDRILALLAPDISAADAYWTTCSKPPTWLPARIHLSVRGLTSTQYFTWFLSGQDDPALQEAKQAAHPEHWAILPYHNSPSDQGVMLVETIGEEHVSRVYMNFHPPGTPAPSSVDVREDYPIKMGGSGHTKDGVHMAELYHQCRDHEDGKGFDADLAAYYAGGCGETVVEKQRMHMAVEFGNWVEMAYESLPGPDDHQV